MYLNQTAITVNSNILYGEEPVTGLLCYKNDVCKTRFRRLRHERTSQNEHDANSDRFLPASDYQCYYNILMKQV